MATVMLTIAVFAACMATFVASESTSSKSYLRTTVTTYDWERCIGGPKTGPKGLYARLCDGELHTECEGTIMKQMNQPHDTECAEQCDDEGEVCVGFEYDNHGEPPCILFSNITGVKPVTDPTENVHQCYRKEPPKVPKCKEEEMLGHYKRLCDREKHGECQGTDMQQYLTHESLQDCADACTANSECAGFEYDSYDTSNDCYLYSEVKSAEVPDWADEFSHECFKRLPTTTSTVTKAATPATPEGDVENNPTTVTVVTEAGSQVSTLAAPKGDAAKSAKASSAPEGKILSTLTVILMVASTFI